MIRHLQHVLLGLPMSIGNHESLCSSPLQTAIACLFLFTDWMPWCFQTHARIIVLLCFVVAEGGMDPNPFNKILSGMNMHSPTIWAFTKVPKFDTQIKTWVCLKIEYPKKLPLYSLLCPYQWQCCDIVTYSISIQTHMSYHVTSSWLVIPLRFR